MNERKLQNIRAFSKLYGYVRFFHPSDEASSIDWDKFAVYGFEKVENAADDDELKALLLELFLPIAPSIEIYLTGKDTKYDLKKIIPANTTGLIPVAWQHKGICTNNEEIYNIYSSQRVNRIPEISSRIGILSKRINADKFAGKMLKISTGCKFPFEVTDSTGEFFVKIINKGNTDGNEISVKCNSDKWKEYSIEMNINPDAEYLEFGCRLLNEGVLFVNGFKFIVNNAGKWEDINITGSMFEDQKLESPPAGWNISDSNYIYQIVDFEKFENEKTCFIEGKFVKQPFEKYPVPGELINKPISTGLSCIVPLALFSDSTGTIPRADENLLNNLQTELEHSKFNELNIDNKYVRLASTVKIWNVIQHSFPYFDFCCVDWDEALSDLLINAVIEVFTTDKQNFINNLSLVTAKLKDGHVSFFHPDLAFTFSYPPFIIDFAEDQYVVSRVFENNTGLLEGDIITEIDGVGIDEAVKNAIKYVSASTIGRQITNILYGRLIKGEKNSEVKLNIIRGVKNQKICIKRTYNMKDFIDKGMHPEYRPEKYAEIKPGIFYADLTRFKGRELEEKLPLLANAAKVIFDMRGYPEFSSEFLSQLTDRVLKSPYWLVPQIIYPDREKINYDDQDGRWEMQPLLPRFKGKVVFITNAAAISWAETIMAIVEEYKLGIIVGSQTAGTNGDVNRFSLPGGFTFRFTGMKVLKHDGTPHHGVGIKPNVPVSRTIKGIREKRDEYLEKALEIIEGK